MDKLKGFWPLPGGIRNYVATLSKILSVLSLNRFDENNLIQWMMKEYSLKSRSSAKHYIDVVKKIGVVDIKDGIFIVNNDGRRFQLFGIVTTVAA